MSAEEKNKTLVHEFFEEAWVKGNVAAVDEYGSPPSFREFYFVRLPSEATV